MEAVLFVIGWALIGSAVGFCVILICLAIYSIIRAIGWVIGGFVSG
jgi:hypothetical protein